MVTRSPNQVCTNSWANTLYTWDNAYKVVGPLGILPSLKVTAPTFSMAPILKLFVFININKKLKWVIYYSGQKIWSYLLHGKS